MFRLIFL